MIAIEVTGRPDLTGAQPIGADGRIDLGDYGKPRIEGRTVVQIAAIVAEETGLPRSDIRVDVADYKSRQLFLFGQVIGGQRTVPYRGQETVLDLLQRVGGITPGAEPDDVYVVRSNIADTGRPEVFHVNLHAIVVNRDEKTNLRLLPDDHVYIGETRQARVERIIPLWFRPLYRSLWNTQAHPETIREEREELRRKPWLEAYREKKGK